MSRSQRLNNVNYITNKEFHSFLYNKINSNKNEIVLDIRSKKNFEVSHVYDSVSIHSKINYGNINVLYIIYDKESYGNLKYIVSEMKNRIIYVLEDTFEKFAEVCPDCITSNIEYPSLILNYLYLGNYIDASDYTKLKYIGVTGIVNCSKELLDGGNFKYMRLNMYDAVDQDIPLNYFYSVFNFIEEEKNKGGKVLIHCYAGISRSSTFVIAYIMWKYKIPFESAYSFVKSIRGIVNPNSGFRKILLKYENTFIS